jgi:hypothetical protein
MQLSYQPDLQLAGRAMTPKESLLTAIQSAPTLNERVRLVRQVPEIFGKASQQEVYAEIAKTVYVKDLAPDFAFVHWREEYELAEIEAAYESAYEATDAFEKTSPQDIADAVVRTPRALRIFRLLLGLTTQEFSASTLIIASQTGLGQIANGTIKNIESGKSITPEMAALLGEMIDQTGYCRRMGDGSCLCEGWCASSNVFASAPLWGSFPATSGCNVIAAGQYYRAGC